MVSLVAENIWEFDLEAALKEISEQRREQALKFKYELGQRLCVLAYLLLKKGLRETYGITENPIFEYNEHGKPSIVGHPEIFFNLSHCKEAVVCVVSDQPIGVDVESIREYRESLVNYTMNDEEICEIESSENPAASFIRFWTMKESLLKLTGEGITDNLPSVLSKLEATGESQNISFQTTFHNRYIYTVASKEQDKL